jgi:hypothetical protein
MSKSVFTILAFVFHFNAALADVHMTINNIDSETIEFKRAGIIPIGAESLYFTDNLGKQYEMSCGGNKLNLRIFKSVGWSNLTLTGEVEKCYEKVFKELKEQLQSGVKLDSIDFIIVNKVLKSGKPYPITEFQMDYSFRN